MFCPECGTQNDDGSDFCVKCKKPLTRDSSARNSANDFSTTVYTLDNAALQSVSPRKKGRELYGAALLAIVAVSLFVWAMTQSPKLFDGLVPIKESALSHNNSITENEFVTREESRGIETGEKAEAASVPASESVTACDLQDVAPIVPSVLGGKDVVWSNVADYDGDGKQEAFALTGEWFGTTVSNGSEVWSQPTLWFISAIGVASEIETQIPLKPFVYVNDVFEDPAGSGYILLSLEVSAGSLASSSCVLGVRGGSPVPVKVLWAIGRDVQLYNDVIVVGHSTIGGYSEEWHEATFDVGVFQLVEGRSLGTTWLHELP